MYTYTHSNKYAYIQTHTYTEKYTPTTPIQTHIHTKTQLFYQNFFLNLEIKNSQIFVRKKKFQPKRITNKNYLDKNFSTKNVEPKQNRFFRQKNISNKINFQVKKLFD